MKLTMLGTGNALVTECYNTCFVMEDKGQYFMVDGGGGAARSCMQDFTCFLRIRITAGWQGGQ